VHPAQLGPGYGAELVGEQRADGLVAAQRLRGPAGQVERAHQQRPGGLAQRRARGQLLGDEGRLVVLALLEQDGGVQLAGRHPDVLQPGDLPGGERVVGGVGQGTAAPQAQPALDLQARVGEPAAGQQAAGVVDGLLEAGRVAAVGRRVERVAARPADQYGALPAPRTARLQHRAQAADVGVDGGHGARGRVALPQVVAQAVGRHRQTALDQEAEEQHPTLGRAQVEPDVAGPCLKRAQQPEPDMVAQWLAFHEVGAMTSWLPCAPVVKERIGRRRLSPFNIVPRLTVHLTGRNLIILGRLRIGICSGLEACEADCSLECSQRTQCCLSVTNDHGPEGETVTIPSLAMPL
jgi:hypothetical protein